MLAILYYLFSSQGLLSILHLIFFLLFRFLTHKDPKNKDAIAVNMVTIKNTLDAVGDFEKSATNKEQREEEKMDIDAMPNSKYKSDVLLLANNSTSSLVNS